jgi:methionine-rich copper-binding protein CopC
MKFARLAYALVLLGCSAVTLAHSHLVKAVPADGSTVKASPPNFVLSFAEPVKLTALSLQKNGDAAKKIAPLPAEPSKEISVPAPQLAAGKYVLSWRAVGDDGHVMPGKVTFTVGRTPASTSAPGATGS